MFCSGCGSKINEGLSYCSRCGKRIAEAGSTDPPITRDTASAVGYIGSAGFVAYIFVVLVFLRSGAPANQLVPISFFYFAALFGICFMLLRYSSGSARARHTRPEDTVNRETAPQQTFLKPHTTAQLDEPSDFGIGSVTEHTTRTLDEIPIKKK